MKNCQDIQPELSAYVDGELTPPQRVEIEAHVASCPRCQRELAADPLRRQRLRPLQHRRRAHAQQLASDRRRHATVRW